MALVDPMKNPICLLLALVATLAPASAFQLKDLLGTRTGSHKETQNGSGPIYKATWRGAKRADGAYQVSETQESGYNAKYLFFKNGKFSAQTDILGGSYIVSTYKGTWKQKGSKVTISANGTDGKLTGTISSTSGGFQFIGRTNHWQITVKMKK